MGITELADLIRRGCDEDQQEAENDRLKLCPTCHKPTGDNQRKLLAGVRYECGHYFEWDRLFDLREREAQTQTRALGHVAARRQLLDTALGWEHLRICAVASRIAPGPCDCGRDERVHQVLTLLAKPYQEASRG